MVAAPSGAGGKGKKVDQHDTKQMGLALMVFLSQKAEMKTTVFLASAVPVLSLTLPTTRIPQIFSQQFTLVSLVISATQRRETSCVLMDAGGS